MKTLSELSDERRNIVSEMMEIDFELPRHAKRSAERLRLMAEKVSLLKSLKNNKEETKNILENIDNEVITDHAVLRWLERKHNININRLRQHIITPQLLEAINSNRQFWSDGEVVFKIDRGCVRTILPISNLMDKTG